MKSTAFLALATAALVTLAGCGGTDPADNLAEMTRIMEKMTETLRTVENGADAKNVADELAAHAARLETAAQRLHEQLKALDAEAQVEFNARMEQSDYPSVAMAFMMELMRVGTIPGAAEKLGETLQKVELTNPADL